MRIKILGVAALLGCLTACAQPAVPGAPVPVTTVAPVEVTPTTTAVPPPAPATTTTKPGPTTTRKSSTRRTTTRVPPQYGYQCRDGDEKLYSICAGHKAWVDGQLELTNCLDSGGTWDIEHQRCTRAPSTTASSSGSG
ncbi:hypothetical protein LWP59_38915 [Amycolatopsis acidiphila]|uniref:Chitin-binding type-2 domain-containing protein n=1 Tax=Amycolatopsis acidiphila TaxID=715473 RepID=A0A558AGT4_9PSEU|nr:hypothetical protein [Amycolatopsis acidiphila]TVT23436.1 hypothetical protein FNH06_09545 [Amycolatopsis acidiphila]UIJ59886.1 hypothetical protein LWP59_38915 [Amycolatopsis acidiphila]GHG62644.1 hypothetical protein GCM10017788_18360 [Amycolatopsis acidiphila]